MEQIRRGQSLHHVDPTEVKSNQQPTVSNNNSPRDQLMNEIRRGVDLKRVEPNASKPETKVGNTPVDALVLALQQRSMALNRSDDDSSDDESGSRSDDDEWDD